MQSIQSTIQHKREVEFRAKTNLISWMENSINFNLKCNYVNEKNKPRKVFYNGSDLFFFVESIYHIHMIW